MRVALPAREALPAHGSLAAHGALPMHVSLPTRGTLPKRGALPTHVTLATHVALTSQHVALRMWLHTRGSTSMQPSQAFDHRPDYWTARYMVPTVHMRLLMAYSFTVTAATVQL